MVLAGKIILGLLGLGGVGLAVGLASTASASEKKKQASAADGLPPDLRAKVQSVLSSGDPVAMRAVADELEKAGFPKQAASLRDAAKAIEKVIDDVDPDKPGDPSSPSPRPTTPAIKQGRVVHVQRGEGEFQVASRVLGPGHAFEGMKQLQAANVPFDADGVPRKLDHHTGHLLDAQLHGLDEGDRLLVPETWPDSPHITVETVGAPRAAISGDGEGCDDADLRRLAGRVALEVASSDKGSENRDLISTYQNAERARGRRKGSSSGLYDAETCHSLAMVHGIAPPCIFGDGAPLYYATNPDPEKQFLRSAFEKLASFDPPRAAEWMQCAAAVS